MIIYMKLDMIQKKMLLGKLSYITLTIGLNILKDIETELKKDNPNKSNLKKYILQIFILKFRMILDLKKWLILLLILLKKLKKKLI